ncbi:DNA mismatch endonuclease Vsr [Jiangella anatolica]|nr:DNA mismatch endonuclease Vsr [Jiangella anatolica]
MRTADLAPSARLAPTASSTATGCTTCDIDQAFLRTTSRPDYESLDDPIHVVDLFCGGGGLSLGVAEAARRAGRGTAIALAVEIDRSAADLYALNFPQAYVRRCNIARLFDGRLGSPPTKSERALQAKVLQVDVLVAGPPCQGHSNLNNSTRREDPRNALYLRAIRAVQVLQPKFAIIENVPAVQHDKGDVVGKAVAHLGLEGSGYSVAHGVLDLVEFGVPQRRRRHILVAVRGQHLDPEQVLESQSPCRDHDERTVRWAISDLVDVLAASGPDSPSKASPENKIRMEWLHAAPGRTDLPNAMRPKCHRDKKHTYVSMYGRLSWDQPAQTITTGFGSMGQGRFVHPSLPRTLTPHEAARLQTLPDFYDMDEEKGRGAWAMVIGNAVPPLLAVHLVEPLLDALGTTVDEADEGATLTAATRRDRMPPASSEVIRRRMKTTKRRDTKPELALRSALVAKNLRFEVDCKINGGRRKTDIVFPTERVAIYVDGCFWHGCPIHGTIPKQNRQWWIEKLEANKARDRATNEALRSEGWRVLRFWEHHDATAAADEVHREILAIRGKAAANGQETD